MADRASAYRLCNISTQWSLVVHAHEKEGSLAEGAQRRLLECYGGAIRRYLLACLRDEEAAEDLFHEFTLRFLRGDFRNVSPMKGRFRDYVKTVIYHMITRYRMHQFRGKMAPLTPETPEPLVEDTPFDDQTFDESWRKELLERCWAALAAEEAKGRSLAYTILRFRSNHPDLSSSKMAEELSRQLGRPLSAAAVRQTLHRAREHFADLLVQAVAESLVDPSADTLTEELIRLGLFEHCREALIRNHRAG